MSSSKQVWILEDDPHAAQVLIWTLQSTFSTSVFGSLAGMYEALQTSDSRPDLCVADITLADAVLLEKKAPLADLRCPWIAVTADQSAIAANWARDAGAVAFLNKPLRPQELLFHARGILSASVGDRGDTREPLLMLDPFQLQLRTPQGTAALTPKEMAIAKVLLDVGARGVARAELQAKVWLGQKTSKKTLHVQLTFLRRKLRPLGWTVQCSADFRYRLERAESIHATG